MTTVPDFEVSTENSRSITLAQLPDVDIEIERVVTDVQTGVRTEADFVPY